MKDNTFPSRGVSVLFIKFLAIERRISFAEVGRKTGIHRTLISQFASGRTRPTPAELSKLAKFFSCKGEELLREVSVEQVNG